MYRYLRRRRGTVLDVCYCNGNVAALTAKRNLSKIVYRGNFFVAAFKLYFGKVRRCFALHGVSLHRKRKGVFSAYGSQNVVAFGNVNVVPSQNVFPLQSVICGVQFKQQLRVGVVYGELHFRFCKHFAVASVRNGGVNGYRTFGKRRGNASVVLTLHSQNLCVRRRVGNVVPLGTLSRLKVVAVHLLGVCKHCEFHKGVVVFAYNKVGTLGNHLRSCKQCVHHSERSKPFAVFFQSYHGAFSVHHTVGECRFQRCHAVILLRKRLRLSSNFHQRKFFAVVMQIYVFRGQFFRIVQEGKSLRIVFVGSVKRKGAFACAVYADARFRHIHGYRNVETH